MSNKLKVCPVCQHSYSTITFRKKGGRYYTYAVHKYKGSDGKWHTYECYLGPAGGYKHATNFNPIGLKGYVIDGKRAVDHEGQRFAEYIRNILKYNLSKGMSTERGIEVLDKLIELLVTRDKDAVKKELEGWLQRLQEEKEG